MMEMAENIKRRNRTLVWIILLVALGSAISGTLYLRHYGFHSDKSEAIRFH
jgi:hypothetical protein